MSIHKPIGCEIIGCPQCVSIRSSANSYDELISYLPKIPTNTYEKELARQNKIMREALEFYGDLKSWRTVTVEDYNQLFCIFTKADLEYFQEPNRDSYCGKRARKALAECEEEK